MDGSRNGLYRKPGAHQERCLAHQIRSPFHQRVDANHASTAFVIDKFQQADIVTADLGASVLGEIVAGYAHLQAGLGRLHLGQTGHGQFRTTEDCGAVMLP